MAVRCLWVRMEPLGVIGEALRWVSRTAMRLTAGGLDWESQVEMWPLALVQLREVMGWVSGPWRMNLVPRDIVAYGVSDAAGMEAGGYRAAIVRTQSQVMVWRMGSVDGRIEVAEFRAAVDPLIELLKAEDVASGRIVWDCDSTVAVGWLRRSWSSEWSGCSSSRCCTCYPHRL